MKKLGSILLTLVIVMTMAAAIPALAAGDGSITIKNATIGKDYAAYKIFDATYSGTNVSYTILGTSAWYDAVEASGLFDLTEVSPADSGIYNAVLTEEVTNAEILTWMKGLSTAGMIADFSSTAATTTVAWTNVPYGYYLITSGLGGAVTVTNNLPDVTIIDKNQSPGWDPEDPENPDNSGNSGKFVKDGDEWGKSNTASIGETVDFKINANAPAYSGSAMVVDYTFTDTLADSLTYTADSLSVTVTGNNFVDTLTLNKDTDYTLTTVTDDDTGETTITVVVNVLSIANYPTDAHVSIAYKAVVNKEAALTNLNSVTMDWRVTDPNDPHDPDDPNSPEPEKPEDYEPEDPDFPNPLPPEDPSTTKTFVYGFTLQKYAKDTEVGMELEGAKFKLYDAETDGTEIPVVLEKTVYDETDPTLVLERQYRVAVTGETGVQIEAGAAKIFGLKGATSYYLEETFAPDGFNMLTARFEVIVSDGRSTKTYTGAADVVNNTGMELPSTGGIGTTIFYVVGGLLMGAAIVLLIVRKRMSASK